MKKLYLLLIVSFFWNSTISQIINFPDPAFKAKLVTIPSLGIVQGTTCTPGCYVLDANGDGEIDQAEAATVTSIQVYNSNISDLTGIEYFVNTQNLNCAGNNLTSLNITALTNLKNFTCTSNYLTSLDLTPFTQLTQFGCMNNQLTSLDFHGLQNLTNFACNFNQLATLDLSGLPLVNAAHLNDNLFTSLNFSEMPALQNLYCQNNSLTELDLTATSVRWLYCQSNDLVSMYLKNNTDFWQPHTKFWDNPNLAYICADLSELQFLQDKLVEYGNIGCLASTWCDFVSGEPFYSITGMAMFDQNENGCDPLDIAYPDFLLSLTEGTMSGDALTDDSGSYGFPVQAGDYVLSPVVSNPTYFSVSPTSVNISLPTDGTAIIQDFCITPNGTHPDLEIISNISGSWGFHPNYIHDYILTVRNSGTETQSGTVTLTFDDDQLDFVDATPMVTSQSVNTLTWDFASLMPFETRQIDFSLYATQNPLPPDGYVLNFNASVSTTEIDETPSNNTYPFLQFVTYVELATPENVTPKLVVYPNPATDSIHFSATQDQNVISLEIFNMLGQKVGGMFNADGISKVDISTLPSGHYIIKAKAGNNSFNSRFIKK